MSTEKRFLIFMLLATALMLVMPLAMEKLGLNPPAPPKEVARKDGDKPAADKEKVKKGPAAPADAQEVKAKTKVDDKDRPKIGAAAAKKDEIEWASMAELVLGSDDKAQSEPGYHLKVQLGQKGAGVETATSALYEAEWVGKTNPKKPMPLIQHENKGTPPSFAINIVPPDEFEPADDDDEHAAVVKAGERLKYSLESALWEVERDAKKRSVHTAPPRSKGGPAGQEIRFRTKVADTGIVVVKRFRLYPGEDTFEMFVEFSSPDEPRVLAYRLIGPHGIPVEGEWYTSTFRDTFIGQLQPNGEVKLDAKTGSDIATTKPEKMQRLSARPLAYAGVENQYFAVFFQPNPRPGPDDHWDGGAIPMVIHDIPENHNKADVTVEVTSKPIKVGPNKPFSQGFTIYAGPKTAKVLPKGAEDLALYRKGWQFWVIGPVATWLSYNVIAPMLDKIYALTADVSRRFGGRNGNYGIAIILLTMTVRLMLFPLGRKTAISAKKMQALQPQVAEIREKYKGDNEKLMRETQALYKRNGVNMFGGCLPALIQLPIFIGLWQALNVSVALRHANFLWINNLAAPDMLFNFGTTLPFLGDYFNVLPFVVVGLMLVQTKLFSPPATTPEAEMQQKTMKFMMIFMAFMFYKVPSGLGLYFITSSLWAICERLLLPKVIHTPKTLAVAEGEIDRDGGSGGKGGAGGGGGGGKGSAPNGKGGGWLAQRLEKLLAEAANDKTIRNNAEGGRPANNGAGRTPGSDRDKDTGKGRSRPGKRR